jgi:hypothetical protein
MHVERQRQYLGREQQGDRRWRRGQRQGDVGQGLADDPGQARGKCEQRLRQPRQRAQPAVEQGQRRAARPRAGRLDAVGRIAVEQAHRRQQRQAGQQRRDAADRHRRAVPHPRRQRDRGLAAVEFADPS